MKKAKKITGIGEIIFGLLFLYYFSLLAESGSQLDFMFLWAATGSTFLLKGTISLFHKSENKLLKLLSTVFDTAFVCYIVSVAVLFCCILSGMLLKAPNGCDCVTVLGAAVIYDEPSEMLKDRIDTAYEYLIKNPDADVVCTGGRSEEDILSEGRCIADSLIEKGIDESRIYVEEKSSTTFENIVFSREFLLKYDNAVIVSSGFHVFRGKFLLSTLTPLKAYGLASTGMSKYTPHYMMREYVAFIVDLFRSTD